MRMRSAAKAKTTPPERRSRPLVVALARGLEILRCFGPGERSLGNQEIARRIGVPKPTVSRLTQTLTELGYLRYSERDGRYALSTGVLSLGFSALAYSDVRRIARPLMQALAEHTQAAVNLGIRDRLSMMYVDRYRNASTYTVELDVGSHVPMANSAMGRAYLSVMADKDRAVLLDAIRKSDPTRWPELKRGLEASFREYQEKGYCLNLGFWRPEVHAIAVTLIPADGSEPMGFSCSGAAYQLGREKLEEEIGPRLFTLVGNVRAALASTR
jgi:DNA-binding IclR family transcriptional regulator